MDQNILRIWIIISSKEPKVLSYLKNKFIKFEDKHNVRIQFEFVTWDRVYTALINAFKNNTAPDILQLGTSWVSTFAYMGYLDQVPNNLTIKPSINEGINRICQYNGIQCAVPWISDTIIMAGRKDYMSQLGISQKDVKDFQAIKDLAKELIERKKDDPSIPKPMSIAIKAERDTIQRFFSMIWTQGWEFPTLEEIPGEIVTDPLIIDTIKYFSDLKMTCDSSTEELEKHPYQVNEEFYLHGSSVFYIGSWYGVVEQINNNKQGEQSTNKYIVLPYPSLNGKTASYGGGSVLAVSSRSKQKEKAWKLVEYLISDDFMRTWIDEMNNVPAFMDKFWQKRFKDERVQLMYEQTINSTVYPPHPAWLAIENQIIKGVGYTLLDLIKQKNTEITKESYTLLKKTDKNIKKILKLYWGLE